MKILIYSNQRYYKYFEYLKNDIKQSFGIHKSGSFLEYVPYLGTMCIPYLGVMYLFYLGTYITGDTRINHGKSFFMVRIKLLFFLQHFYTNCHNIYFVVNFQQF